MSKADDGKSLVSPVAFETLLHLAFATLTDAPFMLMMLSALMWALFLWGQSVAHRATAANPSAATTPITALLLLAPCLASLIALGMGHVEKDSTISTMEIRVISTVVNHRKASTQQSPADMILPNAKDLKRLTLVATEREDGRETTRSLRFHEFAQWMIDSAQTNLQIAYLVLAIMCFIGTLMLWLTSVTAQMAGPHDPKPLPRISTPGGRPKTKLQSAAIKTSPRQGRR